VFLSLQTELCYKSCCVYFVAKTKGEKNGDDDGLGQEIEVSHSNCIVYMTGVVDEKDERTCSPLSYLVVGHHEQVCRPVSERPI